MMVIIIMIIVIHFYHARFPEHLSVKMININTSLPLHENANCKFYRLKALNLTDTTRLDNPTGRGDYTCPLGNVCRLLAFTCVYLLPVTCYLLPVFTCGHLRLPTFTCVYLFLPAFTYFYLPHSPVFSCLYMRLPVFTCVYLCLPAFTCVYLPLPVSTC